MDVVGLVPLSTFRAMSDEHRGEVFFDLHKDLPREGPGSDEATLRALALCTGLPDRPDIIDIGCGPGMQSVALARATDGMVTSVDMHQPFLEQVRANAAAAGVADRVTTLRADMSALPFEPGSFDLVWSEGAAYIMGFAKAFEAWRPLVRPGGYVMASQAVWLVPDPPPGLVDLLAPRRRSPTSRARSTGCAAPATRSWATSRCLTRIGGRTTWPRWRSGSRCWSRSTPVTRRR